MKKINEWTDEMISFMKDASSYSNYFEELAKALVQFIPKDSYVCDAGCGLGQLALELSPYCKKTEGIDINAKAIAELNKSIEKSGVPNVFSRVADLTDYVPKEKFDIMIFNHYGSMAQIFEIKKRCCNGKILIVKRNYNKHRFSIGNNPITGYNAETAKEFLLDNGIPFQEMIFSCEFGQPFRNMEDALSFFKLYSRDDDPGLITYASVKERLTETGESLFPYYLQQKKESRILII